MKRVILTVVSFFIMHVTVCGQALNARYLNYISLYKDIAVDQMHRYGIPASITLAQGLLESGAGRGTLALKSNNHFGIKCGGTWSGPTVSHDDDAYGECFRKYRSVEDSYEDHSLFLTTRQRYSSLFKLSPTDYKGWAYGLKRAGYATSPTYAQNLINLIELYHLYDYDRAGSHSKDKKEREMQEQLKKFQFRSVIHEIRQANGLLCIVAREGDTFKSIGKELGVSSRSLIKNNDLYKGYSIHEGEVIYLQKKLKRSASPDLICHIVKPGESVHSISQYYGIRMKNLIKMNRKRIDADGSIHAGNGIRLR